MEDLSDEATQTSTPLRPTRSRVARSSPSIYKDELYEAGSLIIDDDNEQISVSGDGLSIPPRTRKQKKLFLSKFRMQREPSYQPHQGAYRGDVSNYKRRIQVQSIYYGRGVTARSVSVSPSTIELRCRCRLCPFFLRTVEKPEGKASVKRVLDPKYVFVQHTCELEEHAEMNLLSEDFLTDLVNDHCVPQIGRSGLCVSNAALFLEQLFLIDFSVAEQRRKMLERVVSKMTNYSEHRSLPKTPSPTTVIQHATTLIKRDLNLPAERSSKRPRRGQWRQEDGLESLTMHDRRMRSQAIACARLGDARANELVSEGIVDGKQKPLERLTVVTERISRPPPRQFFDLIKTYEGFVAHGWCNPVAFGADMESAEHAISKKLKTARRFAPELASNCEDTDILDELRMMKKMKARMDQFSDQEKLERQKEKTEFEDAKRRIEFEKGNKKTKEEKKLERLASRPIKFERRGERHLRAKMDDLDTARGDESRPPVPHSRKLTVPILFTSKCGPKERAANTAIALEEMKNTLAFIEEYEF